MEITIKTTTLKDLVSLANKGVGNNKLFPITSMLEINVGSTDVEGEVSLSLKVTDGTNYMTVYDTTSCDVTPESPYGRVTVDADTFIKLIGKMTSESVTLTLEDKYLKVTGNGSYKVELPMDETGNNVVFPSYDFSMFETDEVPAQFVEYNIPAQTISTMVSVCKVALSTSTTEPCYSNYLIADKIVATDRTRGNFVDENLATDKPHILLNRALVDLFSFSASDVTIYVGPEGLYCLCGNIKIFSRQLSSLSDYSEEGVSRMLSLEMPSYCRVGKAEMLDALDRLSIFCQKYSDNAVKVEFNGDSLTMQANSNSAEETIEYDESKDVTPFSMYVDSTLLVAHLKSYESDKVDLYFGNQLAIKLIDGNITQVLALVRK